MERSGKAEPSKASGTIEISKWEAHQNYNPIGMDGTLKIDGMNEPIINKVLHKKIPHAIRWKYKIEVVHSYDSGRTRHWFKVDAKRRPENEIFQEQFNHFLSL